MIRALTWGVLALGVLHSLLLLGQVQEGAFYNGDAGLKLLIIRQFAEGNLEHTLELEHEPWEEALWDAGLYPFAPPFVHASDEGQVVAFPQPFLLLNAPAYRAFGYHGLYIVPLLSVWLLWAVFLRTCRRIGLGNGATLAAATCLILASPLTLYGAILWEHSLACLLLFLGVGTVFEARRDPGEAGGVERGGLGMAVVIGLACGASAWIRSETALLAAGLAAVALFRAVRDAGDRGRRSLCFALGVVVAGGLLIGGNLLVHGHAFGVESGLFEWEAAGARYGKILTALGTRLVEFFPVAVVALLAVPLCLGPGNRAGVQLVALAVAFLCVVPLFVPNSGGKQWGPRYVLALVPLLALSVGCLVDAARSRSSPWWRGTVMGALTVTLALGAHRSLYGGTVHLREDYRDRTLPALEEVLAQESSTVVVNSQIIAQELAFAFESKRFFRAKEARHLELLSDALIDEGHREFLFLTQPRAAFRPSEGLVRFASRTGRAAGLNFEPLGQFGSYEIHRATIQER